MSGMVCAVSIFLMRQSGSALLGQTLPDWRVKALVTRLQAHAAVVKVYDVKTEMVGTDTVRFKAEVQFNPRTITERILQANTSRTVGTETAAAIGLDSRLSQQLSHEILSQRLRDILPQLYGGVPVIKARDESREKAAAEQSRSDAAAAAPWLYRNNDIFYEALVWELKDVEKVLRDELSDFRNVHIDLEPW